jgi:hypothetical protein
MISEVKLMINTKTVALIEKNVCNHLVFIIIYFKLKSFMNYSFQNEKIVMLSCGSRHLLAHTENGHVIGWGHNYCGQLGVNVKDSSKPIIIELNDFKIKKISCGQSHGFWLSCDNDIYVLIEIDLDKLEWDKWRTKIFDKIKYVLKSQTLDY